MVLIDPFLHGFDGIVMVIFVMVGGKIAELGVAAKRDIYLSMFLCFDLVVSICLFGIVCFVW